MATRRRTTVRRRRNPTDRVFAAYRSMLHTLDGIERSIGNVSKDVVTISTAISASAEGHSFLSERSLSAVAQKVQQLSSAANAVRRSAESLGADLFG